MFFRSEGPAETMMPGYPANLPKSESTRPAEKVLWMFWKMLPIHDRSQVLGRYDEADALQETRAGLPRDPRHPLVPLDDDDRAVRETLLEYADVVAERQAAHEDVSRPSPAEVPHGALRLPERIVGGVKPHVFRIGVDECFVPGGGVAEDILCHGESAAFTGRAAETPSSALREAC